MIQCNPVCIGNGPVNNRMVRIAAVSYTHLTLPTSDLV